MRNEDEIRERIDELNEQLPDGGAAYLEKYDPIKQSIRELEWVLGEGKT